MATTNRSSNYSIVPLDGKNYATWKIQVKMALMKENVWGIVAGTEDPIAEGADGHKKYVARRDSALAIIVLAVNPSLLYLLGDPDDPKVVWSKIQDQFQKKSWANKLELRRKLYSMKLLDGESVDEHIKLMTEVFNEMSIIGEVIEEEDKVIHLLASLPDSFKMLVTAFESLAEVPTMETVTERLRHEERKMCNQPKGEHNRALTMRSKKDKACHFCKKIGHFKRDCYEFKKSEARKEDAVKKNKAYFGKGKKKDHSYKAAVRQRNSSSSDDETVGLVVRHALSADADVQPNKWIIDSGATSHMCNDRDMFVKFSHLEKPLGVVLGDGHVSEATGRGTVKLMVNLPNNKTKECKLQDVLYVPKLSYNLLSVARATKFKKKVKFTDSGCYILDEKHKLVAKATRSGSLYYLDYCVERHSAEVAENEKPDIWHRRYGHLGERNLQKLSKEALVDGFDYDGSKSINFCEPCAEGKHHRSPFPTSGAQRSKEVLDLVHSDVCGKMDTQSLGGAEYYVTFIDDKNHYTWVYVLKRKSEVFWN